MKFKGVICAVLVVCMLVVAGCSVDNNDHTTTTQNGTTTQGVQSTTTSATTLSTTQNSDGSTTVDTQNPDTQTTTQPSDTSTTTGNVIIPTIGNQNPITMKEITVNGLPVIVGDRTNRLRVDAAGLLDGNAKNPMFILVTNVGDDDIYSAKINATAGGKEVCFNISYLPRGASVWAESVDRYIYSATDKFIVRNDAVIVSATLSGVPVDTNYAGVLKIYAGTKSGGRGLYVENVSGKKITKVVIRYRPLVSEAGLYAAPSEIVLSGVEADSKYFKPDSYLYGAVVSDVQITY